MPASKLLRSSIVLPSEIVFTSGGTEGDNLALKGMMSPGDHIIISTIEHSAILGTCTWLEHLGCEVTRIGVSSNGQVEPGSVRQALRKNTRLISIMMANNETGVLQPVEEIGKIAAEADVWFHTDAVQAAGKVPISVRNIRCDLLTISGHKIARATRLRGSLRSARHSFEIAVARRASGKGPAARDRKRCWDCRDGPGK